MAQATTAPPPTAAPPGFGTAFAETSRTAHELTADQAVELADAFDEADADAYEEALCRLDGALSLLGVDGYEDVPAQHVAYAVLARDRGVINAGDFQVITKAWAAAGLPLPTASTGDVDDDAPISEMTTDRICDELVHAAADTPAMGPVLLLTGYNYGELLAYPSMRDFVARGDDDLLYINWQGLERLFDGEDGPELKDLPDEAVEILSTVLDIVADGDELVPAGSDNAELLTLALAYTFGTEHMIDPSWDNNLPRPAASPVPSASDPGE